MIQYTVITKDITKIDGNKRIAATLFLWFLNNNHVWKIQSELTPRANVSLTPENFLILTP